MSALRVLVIDDSLTIRAMIEHLVQREPGSRVVGMATDGRAARGLAEDLMPNVITLDLDMPGLDGWRYLDALRGTLHPPVVVVSTATKEGSDAADAAMMHGAAACFDKARLTDEADRFLDLLKRVASRRGVRRAPPPLRR